MIVSDFVMFKEPVCNRLLDKKTRLALIAGDLRMNGVFVLNN
jgi:hypothetical protein